jgi:hypothetical protein
MRASDILRRLKGLTFSAAQQQLLEFDSYDRTIALPFVLHRAPTLAERLKVFLDWWHLCDAPWGVRSDLARLLRSACSEVRVADLLSPDARSFYEGLPALVPVWRGCERGRERGLSWTTDRIVAERFATGQRCINQKPTLVLAEIPKPHIFAVFVDRSENEVVLDYKRLRKLNGCDLRPIAG